MQGLSNAKQTQTKTGSKVKIEGKGQHDKQDEPDRGVLRSYMRNKHLWLSFIAYCPWGIPTTVGELVEKDALKKSLTPLTLNGY